LERADNEELHNVYFSPGIIGTTELTKMRCAGHVARMGRRGMFVGFWWESRMDRTMMTKTKWSDNIRMDLREAGLGWYGLD
jgi:hypothetical protein